jgi:putative addiction module component (TIGR02574 family)
MSTALEEITQSALKLSRRERMALASRLLTADEDGGDTAAEIEAAWEEEILGRIEAIDEGTAVGVPYEEVKRAARERRAK